MRQPDLEQLADAAWALTESRRFREANGLFEKLCELDPGNPECWLMRGVTQTEMGDARLGATYMKAALELDPDYADPCLHLAKFELNEGNLEAARRLIDRAVTLDPAYTEAWVLRAAVYGEVGVDNEVVASSRQVLLQQIDGSQTLSALARSFKEKGNFTAAIALYRALLERHSLDDSSRLSLAFCLCNTGHDQEALQHYKHSLDKNQGSVEAWMGIAGIYQKSNLLVESLGAYQRALAINPGIGAAHNEIGNIYLAQKNLDKAREAYQLALTCEPLIIEALANLGMIHEKQARYGAAKNCYEQALEKMPDNADLHRRLASVNECLGGFDVAVRHYEIALKLDPSNTDCLIKKARILQKIGDYGKSLEILTPIVEGGHSSVNAVLCYASAQAHEGNAEQAINSIHDRMVCEGLTQHEQQRLHSALGTLLDKVGRYDEAFSHFSKAAELKVGNFDLRAHARYTAAIAETFSREYLAKVPRSGVESEQPVFIVGMPRSGTSLVEQILASHPSAHGAGELEDIGRIAETLFVNIADRKLNDSQVASQAELAAAAADYLEKRRSLNTLAARIIDKMPHNYLHLGVIELLFPNAKVIHVKRNALDTCLSCYFQEFNQVHSYSYSLDSLAGFYKLYESLMRHWMGVSSLPILTVEYEELIRSQEDVSRKIVDFCGLPWDGGVLNYHENRRYVSTPSFDQVRRPIYSSSVNRWINYRANINALISAFDMANDV